MEEVDFANVTADSYNAAVDGPRRLGDQRAILGAAVGFGLNRNTPQFRVALADQWEPSAFT
ncbi:hypothetical protein E8E01_01515 [Methylorubrum populi]|uniref:Uncharacterized protein n=1 Tax=Methylorubrum populi TaxID=223967 RepID=A0A514KHV9_9HYPH|nr:hypothetical protein F8B43_5554 [Methylorubrum populi]QDI79200.1 hypothetical protein E8E01_01515 [Methylorubrum populi]